MVHQREGGGKISSPHLVEAFGDQKPPKIGRFDLDWIIIFFFIHPNDFRVKKVEESTRMTILTDGMQFGKFGSKTF